MDIIVLLPILAQTCATNLEQDFLDMLFRNLD